MSTMIDLLNVARQENAAHPLVWAALADALEEAGDPTAADVRQGAAVAAASFAAEARREQERARTRAARAMVGASVRTLDLAGEWVYGRVTDWLPSGRVIVRIPNGSLERDLDLVEAV